MLNRKWLTSDWRQRRGYGARKVSLPRKTKVKLGLALTGWMLMGLVLLLTGCAWPPPKPCEQPPLPTQPALSEPIPSESYSSQWKKLAEEWRKKLTFTQTTSEPSQKHGQSDINQTDAK